ncbi:MlaC/ttg2D family ABC transporter substrate-binding protein [Rhodovibrio sodomensis]|nr:ABC transporter substrate-binding protein [Rhodovibrio sodomensis]
MTSLNGEPRIPGVRRRNLMRGLTAGLAALLLAVAAPATAQNDGGRSDGGRSDRALAERAATYITELSRNAIEQLSPDDISAAERAERARKILEENFAGHDLARFVLGRYWRVASPQQRERFITLLREVALTRFLPTFQNLSMDQVTIERAIADPQATGMARVITRVDVPDRAPVELAWRVRPTDDGGFQIVDIMAEGVSMAITLRSEYSSVIEQNGGRVEALLTRLENRLRSDSAPDWAKN